MALLTDREIQAVMVAIKGSGPLTEPQLQGIVDWANLVKTQAGLLELVNQGRLVIDVTGSEPVFSLAPEPAGIG
jgi:hypothetical protein